MANTIKLLLNKTKGAKRLGTIWEIQNYVFPGQPSTQNWVKLKTMKRYMKIHPKNVQKNNFSIQK